MVAMNAGWKVTKKKVQAVIDRIVETSRPKRLIIFGSYVRGDMDVNSDLDVLVVTGEEIENPRKESVRIRRALKGILMPMDIIVVTENRLLDDLRERRFISGAQEGPAINDVAGVKVILEEESGSWKIAMEKGHVFIRFG